MRLSRPPAPRGESPRSDLAAPEPLTGDAAFHAQQAVETSPKAFLTWHSRPFGKTHNLVEIGAACCAIDPSLDPLPCRAAPLTEYAWRYRYPGEPIEPEPPEKVEAALVLAREVLDAILDRLPGEIRS